MNYDKLVKLHEDLIAAEAYNRSLRISSEADGLQLLADTLRDAIYTEDPTETVSRPGLGSRWRHTNGNMYTVTGYSNDTAPSDKYPLTIHYMGDNGNNWSRQLSRWHGSMTFVPAKRRDLTVGVCQARQMSDEMYCHHCALRCDVNDAAPPECGRLKGQPMRTGSAS